MSCIRKMSKREVPIKKSSLPEIFRSGSFSYYGVLTDLLNAFSFNDKKEGMADLLPVNVPAEYTRAENVTHLGVAESIPDSVKFAYGTAGFRNQAEKLTFIAFRCGYLAALRARQQNKTIGIMITASHNPDCDNGVKIVDPEGDMLAPEWEKFATELVNSTDEQFPTAVRALEVQVTIPTNCSDAKVVCAWDTRASGQHLMEAVRNGTLLVPVAFQHYGVLTTPQLHYIVKCSNVPTFGEANELGYYVSVTDAFKKLYTLTSEPKPSNYSNQLILDCANGVGAPKMHLLDRFLNESQLKIDYKNENGILNYNCGADFVKIQKNRPDQFSGVTVGAKCASFDGDADRLIYFRLEEGMSIELLDGDKIAVLFAKYFRDQMNEAGLDGQLTFGIVQTAYANGNSTAYISNELGIKTVIVPTGVKHLHHAASKFDIGIYFEANGHGTVTFGERFEKLVRNSPQAKDSVAIQRLQLISRVINEVVGDAIADMLAVEVILRHYGWSVDDWAEKLYMDAPNLQIKIPVADRSIFKTTFEETTLLEPSGLQEKIDAEVSKYDGARAFVRPSGTENIVRVYAEAQKTTEAEKLGRDIEKVVLDHVKNL